MSEACEFCEDAGWMLMLQIIRTLPHESFYCSECNAQVVATYQDGAALVFTGIWPDHIRRVSNFGTAIATTELVCV